MENEKLTYINSRGERLELGVDSVYHCNISKDVEGISGVTSVIYSTNSMGQHGEDIAGSLQLQIEELAAAMQEVKKQAEAGTKETKEAIAVLDERLKRVESGWGIDYKHDAVLGLCYMGAAYMSQHYERTVETAVLGATYVGNSYLANTF